MGAGGGSGRAGSVGSMEDMFKRKRKELERSRKEEDIFKRNRITVRSLTERREMQRMIREIRDRLIDLTAEVREQGRRLGEEVEEMRREYRE